MSNSKDAVIARISSLLKEQKKTQKELMEYLGIGHGAFTHWKNDDRKSFYQYIAEISNFLNTTPNYLLLGQQANMDISSKENEVLNLLRNVSSEQLELVINILRNFAAIHVEG